MRDRIKPPCTYVNKILPHSPKLPPNSAELWRGSEEGYKQEREVRSDQRRMISAVWRVGALGRAVSFWRERGLPLPRQSSGGPSTFAVQGVRIVWVAVPVQTTLLDDTRVECSGREVATQHSHSLPFMLRVLLVSSILRGQTKHSDGTTSLATDVLSERKSVHRCVLM